MSSLLPPNSTELERKFSLSSAQATNHEVQIKTLVTINHAPKPFLSFLAFQHSVDRWAETWTDKIKRDQIKQAFNVHQKKGTIKALKTIAESFGFSVKIIEWFNSIPVLPAGTFKIILYTNGIDLTERGLNAFIELMNDAKPLTRHYLEIRIVAPATHGSIFFKSAVKSGDDTIIFPFPRPLLAKTHTSSAFYEHQFDTIYPIES